MQIDLPDGLQHAGPTDWRKLADITAEAFAEDPVNLWLFGNPRTMKTVFSVLARGIYAKHGFCYFAGDQGAAMWSENELPFEIGRWDTLSFAMGVSRYGTKGAMKRVQEAGANMARHHPKEPHYYLFTIGTRNAARGQGVGKALLAPVLKRCDEIGMPCYLENSNPANHGFYSAHGFERLQVFPVGLGGPPMEAMWRTPR